MLTKFRLLSYFGIVLFFFTDTASGQKVDNTDFFSKLKFHNDTLFIKARFMECGEWGGDIEMTKIYLKDDNFYFSYKKYKADCEKIKENNGEPTQTLVQFLEKLLDENGKQLVKHYACQLATAKFREPEPMHAGYLFELKNTDETLKIHVDTWGQTTKDAYLFFIAQL